MRWSSEEMKTYEGWMAQPSMSYRGVMKYGVTKMLDNSGRVLELTCMGNLEGKQFNCQQ
jgi:hypothetical protein